MYSKYPINRDNRLNTKKNCINLQLVKSNFEKSLPSDTQPSIIGRLVIVQPNTKVISTSDRQTDGRTDIANDNRMCFFRKEKKTTKNGRKADTNLMF